jgi:hypothetical protein
MNDKLLQATCETIVTLIAGVLDAEPSGSAEILRAKQGPILGKRLMINATGEDKLLNLCRISMLDESLSPTREVARIEYAHDKQGKFGKTQVYSVQRVRRNALNELELDENFLAADESHVRDADFQPIHSEEYAQKTVLATIKDWVKFRKWQLEQVGPAQTPGPGTGSPRV